MGVNKILLHNFLESQDGPVARYVEKKAQETVEGAKFYARQILWRRARADPGFLNNIKYEFRGGNEAVIGIENSTQPRAYNKKSLEEYLAYKENTEDPQRGKWLRPGLADAFSD